MEKETLLFEQNPVSMLISDPDSLKILKVNKAALEQYGYSQREFEKLTLKDLRPADDTTKSGILEELNQEVSDARILRHEKKNGDLFYVQVKSYTYSYNGCKSRMVLAMDITDEIEARKDAEEAYRQLDQLVKKNPLATIKWDKKLQVEEWSKRAEELSGFNEEEMRGKFLFDLNIFTDEVKRALKTQIKRLMQEESIEQLDTRIRTKYGQMVDIRIHVSMLRNQSGGPQKLLTFVEDISQAENAKRQLSRQVEITRFINELSYTAGGLENQDEALQKVVNMICEFIDWPVGHVYKRVRKDKFESLDIWYLGKNDYQPIVELSNRVEFESGKGFLGRIIERDSPLWLKDIHKNERFLRKPSNGNMSLRTCFAFPVKARGQISVILEFFHDGSLEMQPELLEMADAIGSQMGRVLERIRTHEEMELSERKYRRLFERANDGILILQGSEIVDCNRTLEEMFDCMQSDLIGETLFGFSPPRQPDGQKSKHKGLQYIRKALSGIPQVFEWNYQKPSGELIDTEVSLNRILLHDGTYLQAIVRDLTEQKKAEREIRKREKLFETLFLKAPTAMCMVNPDNEVMMVNNSFEELFRYSEEEIKNKELDQFIVSEKARTQNPVLPKKVKKEGKYLYNIDRYTKDGERLDVILAAIPIYLDNKLIAGVSIYINISDLKEAQRKLQESLNEKEILLKEIHHRVKNNLAVISALLELQVFNEENKRLARILDDSLLRIKTMALVHETLYKTENFVDLQLGRYIENLIGFNTEASVSNKKDIDVISDIEEINLNINQAIPCALILNEFVSNALKYAFEGKDSGCLRVRIWEKGDDVHVLVEDDGIGLPEDFEEKRKKSMGMTLIDQLSKQLEGDLNIESDGGTRFELVFEKKDSPGSSSHFL